MNTEARRRNDFDGSNQEKRHCNRSEQREQSTRERVGKKTSHRLFSFVFTVFVSIRGCIELLRANSGFHPNLLVSACGNGHHASAV